MWPWSNPLQKKNKKLLFTRFQGCHAFVALFTSTGVLSTLVLDGNNSLKLRWHSCSWCRIRRGFGSVFTAFRRRFHADFPKQCRNHFQFRLKKQPCEPSLRVCSYDKFPRQGKSVAEPEMNQCLKYTPFVFFSVLQIKSAVIERIWFPFFCSQYGTEKRNTRRQCGLSLNVTVREFYEQLLTFSPLLKKGLHICDNQKAYILSHW